MKPLTNKELYDTLNSYLLVEVNEPLTAEQLKVDEKEYEVQTALGSVPSRKVSKYVENEEKYTGLTEVNMFGYGVIISGPAYAPYIVNPIFTLQRTKDGASEIALWHQLVKGKTPQDLTEDEFESLEWKSENERETAR